jgi:RNA polymerase sigma factor (TIGR02999 family)
MIEQGRDAPGRRQISELLADWARHPAVRDRLMPLVYEELRRIARQCLRRERPGHTLQATALVNEVYLRLDGLDRMAWRDRAHFLAMAAMLMRRILVDHARRRQREKRGGSISVTSLDAQAHDVPAPTREIDLLALDEALTRLGTFDDQQRRIVEMRFFGGLTVEETGSALGISPTTVKREWAIAKAWLLHQLTAV